jgi:cytochrome c peroxidase
MNRLCYQLSIILVISGLAACGGGGGSDGTDTDSVVPPGDADQVRSLALAKGFDGHPANGMPRIEPAEGSVEQLGKLLFFSRTLSGSQDVACASCHMPHLGGADGLSLPVGVAAAEPWVVGPGRIIEPGEDLDPNADGGPNVPRNSQTIFNVGLYQRALFHDGRIFVPSGSSPPAFKHPESGVGTDSSSGNTMLEVQSLFPLVSDQEMRNFRYPELSVGAYRQLLLDRLREDGNGAGASWESRFQTVFGAREPSAITLPRVQQALAAYQQSQIFVDSPWSNFVADEQAPPLSAGAMAGARLFYAEPEEGGLGCAGCHSGDRLTNEEFYNVGFPQMGRGKRSNGDDFGRWQVTGDDEDRFAFRVPSLLNIGATAPYGHAGTFQSLRDALIWHADPAFHANNPAPFLLNLDQFESVLEAYPDAGAKTLEAVNSPSFAAASALLPNRALTSSELDQLEAFLLALDDPCVHDVQCLAPWFPDEASDPDGRLLVAGESFTEEGGGGEPPTDPTGYKALDFPAGSNDRNGFPDMENCADTVGTVGRNTGEGFVRRSDLGLSASHGYTLETYLQGNLTFQPGMFSGGLTATYISTDCWPDILFAGGDFSGLVYYRNLGQGAGFVEDDLFHGESPADHPYVTGVYAADLNGDYRRELLLSEISANSVIPVFAQRSEDGLHERILELSSSRPAFGISFADFDRDGYPGFFVGRWSRSGVDGAAPALFNNDAGNGVYSVDAVSGTSQGEIDQEWNFTPAFADFSGDGWPDLVVASDFETSLVLHNTATPVQGEIYFDNVTDRDVITDENGMGSAVGDFNNDGWLDWFVTSVFDPEPDVNPELKNWGATGNRLYLNQQQTTAPAFADVTEQAGVRDGRWGWGACAADFNNDGLLDIFHVNGFGLLPQSFEDAGGEWAEVRAVVAGITGAFHQNRPRLFINTGITPAGVPQFTESAAGWGLVDGSQGTGLTCLDYDRDGDVDLALVDNQSGIQFYENQTGSASGHAFVSVRLQGQSPNTEALGARVRVSADLGGTRGMQQQTRVVQANSNYNGQNPLDMHFGLGEATMIPTLEIRWPDGSAQVCAGLAVNQFLVFRQGQVAGRPECTELSP